MGIACHDHVAINDVPRRTTLNRGQI